MSTIVRIRASFNDSKITISSILFSNRFDGAILPDDTFVESFFNVQQTLGFGDFHSCYWYTRPLRNEFNDV